MKSSHAVDVVQEIARVATPPLERLIFTVYSPGPGFEERVSSEGDSSLLGLHAKAMELRKAVNNDLPYWEAVLAVSWTTEKYDVIVKELLKHDSRPEINRRFEVAVKDLTPSFFNELTSRLSGEEVLGICSLCQARGARRMHIPMMDFRCLPSNENLTRVEIALKTISQGAGVVLNSGRSYHYYGFHLMDERQWLVFMAKFLLLSPLVDARYVAHRIMVGSGVLRLTTNSRKPNVPTVVKGL